MMVFARGRIVARVQPTFDVQSEKSCLSEQRSQISGRLRRRGARRCEAAGRLLARSPPLASSRGALPLRVLLPGTALPEESCTRRAPHARWGQSAHWTAVTNQSRVVLFYYDFDLKTARKKQFSCCKYEGAAAAAAAGCGH